MAGGVTIPGNMNIQGDLVFPNQTTIKGAGRLHITGEELLYILNKKGVMIGKEWGGDGNLQVQGNQFVGGNITTTSMTINGDLTFPNATTIKGAGRLHIGGEELLYLLNKAGVVVGKEWGGTGNLAVQGDLFVQGRNILAELNECVKFNRNLSAHPIPDGNQDAMFDFGSSGRTGSANGWSIVKLIPR
jgi:hypothetical protein